MGHIQMGVYLHGGPNTGMADRLGKSGKVKVRVIFIVQIVVGHISMPQAMDIDGMGEADGRTDLRWVCRVLEWTELPKGNVDEPQIYLCSRSMAAYFSLFSRKVCENL